jgi:nucleoside-diphosphate-sugar epimerase
MALAVSLTSDGVAKRKPGKEYREKTMKVLLTGGSGNLGQALVPRLLDKGDTPVILDVRASASLNEGAGFIEGSVLDRSKLKEIFRGCADWRDAYALR